VAAADYSSYYGTLANYFSNSSGSKSQGKSGGAGGSGQQYNPTTTGTGSTGDAVQGGNASSGSGWISAAVSATSSDKSQFTTPFSQQFGGITNNQVINSPGATGAVTTSPIAPITSPQGGGTAGDISGAANPLVLIAIIFAGVALVLHAR
jgi:hypothetical protein